MGSKQNRQSSQASISTHAANADAQNTNSDEAKYKKFVAQCLDLNVSEIPNRHVFKDKTFNVSKLSLSEQSQIKPLIVAGKGRIVQYQSQYLVCSAISTSDFE